VTSPEATRRSPVAWRLRLRTTCARLHTEDTHNREESKRVYYPSIEFLLGRSLANDITNLHLRRDALG